MYFSFILFPLVVNQLLNLLIYEIWKKLVDECYIQFKNPFISSNKGIQNCYNVIFIIMWFLNKFPQYTTSSYPIKTEAGLSNNKHGNKTTVHVNAGKMIDRYVSSNIIPGY